MSATVVVLKGGHFDCDGTGCCGGSDFQGREELMRCFHCDSCAKFIREGLKIIDNRGEVGLGMFIKRVREDRNV